MKKYLFIAAATALVLAACNKEQEINTPANQDKTVVLTFTSQKPVFSDETKTEWDATTQSILWSTGDQIRVGYTKDGSWMGQSEAGTPKFYVSDEVSIDGTDAHLGTFSVPVYSGTGSNTGKFVDPAASANYVFYGIYPKGVGDASAVSSEGIATLTLPSTQTPDANSFDKTADIMIGKTETITRTGLPTDPIEITWERLVAQLDITINNLATVGTEKVSEIVLTSSGNIAGTFTANLLTGAVTAGTESSIVIKGKNLTISSSSVEAWCSVLPGEFTSLGIVVKTDKATYTKNITGISGKEFKKNARNTMRINMTGAERKEILPVEYALYSGDITAGDYIIYDETDGHALKAEVNSGNRLDYEEVTPVSGVIATNDASIVWRIAISGNYVTLYNESVDGYAAATSTNNKAQLLSDGTDDMSLWSVSGTYDFINKSNERYLRSNGSNGFAAYASSTGHALQLYKVDNRTALSAPATVSAALNATVSNSIDVTFDDTVTDADSYVIVATPAAGGADVIKEDVADSPATIEGLSYNTEYIISVYAVPASTDADHKRSPATSAADNVTTGPAPAKPEGYELISTLTELETGVYVIVGKTDDTYYAMPEIATGKISGTAVTVSDGFIAKADGNAYALNINKNSDGKISIGDGANYLQIKASGTDFGTTTTETFYTVSVSSGIFAISNTRYLAWRGGSYLVFGNYANITGEYSGVYLFKYNREPDPVINASTTKTVGYIADTHEIAYTISHPVSGKSISAAKDVDWISNFNYTASSVEFDVAANTGDERTGTITLSYEGAADVEVTVTQEAFPGYTFTLTGVTDGKVYLGGEATDDVQITASSALAWTATSSFEAGLTDSFEIDPTSGAAGATVTMTIMAAEDNNTGAARKLGKITLNNGQDTEIEVWQNKLVPLGSGTLANPYTASGALAYIATLSGSTASTNAYYVTGTITGTPSISDTFWNAEYDITDGVETIKVYRGLYYNGESFTATDQLSEGDVVVVYGKLQNYNSNTPEIISGNYIYSLNGVRKLVMSDINCTDSGENEDELNFSWDAVTGASGYQVKVDDGTYGSTQNATSFKLDGLDAGTNHTIYVKAIGNGTTILNSEPKQKSGTTKSSSGTGFTMVANQKITFSESGYTNQQAITSVSGTNWSMTLDKGTNSSNAPKYYTSGSAIRCYGGNTFTVTVASGFKIESIKLTFGSSDGSNAITTDVGTYENGTWTGAIANGGSVTFTVGGTSGNRRLAAIEIN